MGGSADERAFLPSTLVPHSLQNFCGMSQGVCAQEAPEEPRVSSQ